MTVTLSPPTKRLLDQRMREGEYSSPDELIRCALEALDAPPVDKLDRGTQAAIERAEEQADGGQGIPADKAFHELRRKHFEK